MTELSHRAMLVFPFLWLAFELLVTPGPHRFFWSVFTTASTLFGVYGFIKIAFVRGESVALKQYLIVMGVIGLTFYVLGDLEDFIRFEQIWTTDDVGEKTITVYNSNPIKYPAVLSSYDSFWGLFQLTIKVVATLSAAYAISWFSLRNSGCKK